MMYCSDCCLVFPEDLVSETCEDRIPYGDTYIIEERPTCPFCGGDNLMLVDLNDMDVEEDEDNA